MSEKPGAERAAAGTAAGAEEAATGIDGNGLRRASVSPFNFEAEVVAGQQFASSIAFHDTTLRDGEQHATVIFDRDDKLAIAEALDSLGVHRIEAGMPAVSREEQATIHEISKRVTQAEVFALVRSRVDDIDQATAAGVKGVCVEMLVNDVLAAEVFGWNRDEAVEMLIEACTFAKAQGLYVTAFMIDTTRARPEWLSEFVQRVGASGAVDAFAVVDTVGACSPEAIRWAVRHVRHQWSGPLEIHVHNDFGFGAANTLAALACGVSTAHVCVNGLGERVGNAPLEQVAVALEYLYARASGIDLTQLQRICADVSRRSGVRIADNQPITGPNIYKIQSGLGAYYWREVWDDNPELYYALHPNATGHDAPSILLGKLSGSANVLYWSDQLGLDVTSDEIPSILEELKERSSRERRLVDPSELAKIVAGLRVPVGDRDPSS